MLAWLVSSLVIDTGATLESGCIGGAGRADGSLNRNFTDDADIFGHSAMKSFIGYLSIKITDRRVIVEKRVTFLFEFS